METQNRTMLAVECTVNAPVAAVWEYWTRPEHITQWCYATPEWHSPRAENDLRAGGRFMTRMEAKDGSMGFDFWGVYDVVRINEYIEYTMGDSRKAKIHFIAEGSTVKVVESFETENMNPPEMQQAGWQAILDNFKNYAESK